MVEPSTVLPIIAPIGFILAIGVLLDRIVSPSPLPLPSKSNISPDSPWKNHIRETYRFIFEEFFKGRLFSFPYLTRVASLSVSLFLCTLVLWDWPSFSEEYDLSNRLQIMVLVACAFFNIMVDAVSARITKAFMWFSISTKSTFNTVVALLSDLVFTVSAFKYIATMLFAGFYFLTISIFFDFEQSKEKELSFSYQKVSLDDDMVELQVGFKVDGSPVSASGTPYSFALLRVKRGDLFPFHLLNGLLDVIGLKSVSVVDNESGIQLFSISVVSLDDGTYSFDLPLLLRELAALPDGRFEIEFLTDGIAIPRFPALTQVGHLFEQLNVVEANILGDGTSMFGASAMALPYNELFGYSYGFTPFTDESICYSNAGFISMAGVPDEYRCDDGALVLYGVSRSPIFDLWSWNKNLQGVKFPVGAMLLTSVWFSMFLYVYFLGYFVQRIGNGYLIRWVPHLKFFFSKAPFSIGALLLGTILSLILNLG